MNNTWQNIKQHNRKVSNKKEKQTIHAIHATAEVKTISL